MSMPQRTFIRSSQVTTYGSMRMRPKQNNSPLCGLPRRAKSNESWLWKKHFEADARLFFGKTGHVTTLPLEHRRTINSEWYTTIWLPKVFGEIRKTNKRRRIIMRSYKLTHGLWFFDRLKRRIDGSSAVQPWLGTQWLLFIPAYQEKIAWSTIFVARRSCWSVQKPCFNNRHTGVQTHGHRCVRPTLYLLQHIRL